jgi:HTH-type transcriptional regulator / antitoxin HigA
MATANQREKAHDRYFDLVLQFPLRPIRSDEDLDKAICMVDTLLDRRDLSAEEEDYLDVLGDLIERYENDAHPMPPVSDADMLRHLIEAKGVSQTEVAEATEIAVSTISEVL